MRRGARRQPRTEKQGESCAAGRWITTSSSANESGSALNPFCKSIERANTSWAVKGLSQQAGRQRSTPSELMPALKPAVCIAVRDAVCVRVCACMCVVTFNKHTTRRLKRRHTRYRVQKVRITSDREAGRETLFIKSANISFFVVHCRLKPPPPQPPPRSRRNPLPHGGGGSECVCVLMAP